MLGGGGPTGHAWEAGVLAAIADVLGWDARAADLIMGTSAGGQVATLLRAGLSPADLVARAAGEPLAGAAADVAARYVRPGQRPRYGLRDLRPASPRCLGRLALRPRSARIGTVLAAVLPAGKVSLEPMRAGFPERWPREGLWICAVDLDTGRRVIFGSPGAPEVSPGTAMAASAAVPAWFAPVRVEGRRYVDGGMHSPTNLDAFAGLGLGTVVVLSPLSVDGSAARGRGLALAQRRSLRRALRREASGLRDEGAVVTFVEPTAEELAILGPNPMNTKRVPAVARGIRDSMRRRLERGELRDHLAPLGERARSA